ncbi:MAG: spore maturation protein [Erysipelotrichaceae bacterium]|nr:spore maturation protein [Erysipelotrichaceae bacterium]
MFNYIMSLVVPGLVILAVSACLVAKKNGFELFTKGSKEGISLFLEIFPTMIAMLTAVATLRASGLIEDFALLLSRVFSFKKEWLEIFPLAIFRPISGTASTGIVSDICRVNGADSNVCRMASSLVGCTDTTVYVLSLYFGSIGITKWRHALKAGIVADIIGMSLAITLSLMIFGL